jgi:hypothetical protein
MNQIEQVQSTPHLVALQMADQVPFHCTTTDLTHLLFQLGHTVFTTTGETCAFGCAHYTGWMALGHGHNRDWFGSPGAAHRPLDLLLHPRQPIAQPRLIHV